MTVVRNPMAMPTNVVRQIASPAATQGSTPLRKSQPAATIASAVTEPTERSMPPEIKRIVMPTTTMLSMAKTMAMARRLSTVRK
ncbi:hypothetical protein D3C86_985880 [compost metagenome]